MSNRVISSATLRDGELPQEIFDLVYEQFRKEVISEIDLHHPVGATWQSFAIRLENKELNAIDKYTIRVVDMDLHTVICRAEVTTIEK